MHAITSETMDPTIPQPHGSTTMIASNSLELDARPTIDDDDEVSEAYWMFQAEYITMSNTYRNSFD